MKIENTKNILIFLSVFLIVSNCENNKIQLKPGLITTGQMRYLGHDGYRKVLNFLLSIPNYYISEGKFPLVIILHENDNKAESVHNFWKPVTDSIARAFRFLFSLTITPEADASWTHSQLSIIN